jgi:serine/threonine protein kinase
MTSRSSDPDRADRLDSLFAQLLGDIDAGNPVPALDELRARYPEFADELIEHLSRHSAFAGLAGKLNVAPTTSFALPSFDGYERLELLGHGSFGDVYRARDLRLGREVAIKVLREEYALDPVWRTRFEREGQLLATFNHPNVAVIHGLGETDGAVFLVMELVPGPTLAEVLQERPLALDRALGVAKQIAEALEAAHEKAIIHRDLKPANVKLTPDGLAKVLDFGLARSAMPGSQAHESTALGTILGTAAYMSPEQARGERVDQRSDIWSFGCVLFEMVSRARPFSGKSYTDCLAAVLTQEPDWSALPTELPPRLGDLIRRCLRKDRRRRFHDIADVRIELEEVMNSPPPSAPGTPEWHGELLLGRPAAVCQPAISPDGKSLAYLQLDRRLTQIGFMNLSSGHRKLLTTDRNLGSAFHPCWSPDGAWIYFARTDSTPLGVFRVSITDQHVEPILDNADSPQPQTDGSVLVGRIESNGQYRVVRYWPDSNRLQVFPTAIVHLFDELSNFPSFQALPDGKTVVGWRKSPDEAVDGYARLFAMDLETGGGQFLDPTIRMGELACGLAVAPDGNSVWVAQRLDGRHALRVLSVPRNGRPARMVLTLPGGSSGLAIDAGGSLYLSVTQPFCELLRFPRLAGAGTVPERLTQGGIDWEVPTALPDGRILFGETAAGRHRVVTVKQGERDRPFVQSNEDTWLPAAVLSDKQVALSIGPGHARDIALVDIRSGRILNRHRLGLNGLASVAALGDTLYFALQSRIWTLGRDDARPRSIGDGTSAALNPDGEFLLAICPGSDGPCVRRIPTNGGPQSDIPVRGQRRLHHLPIAGNAIGADGRALVLTMSSDSYFNVIALLDPQTGQLEPIDLDYDGDLFAPTYGSNDTVLAVGRPFHSEIWRFRSAVEKAS